jgi:hypothetical protein
VSVQEALKAYEEEAFGRGKTAALESLEDADAQMKARTASEVKIAGHSNQGWGQRNQREDPLCEAEVCCPCCSPCLRPCHIYWIACFFNRPSGLISFPSYLYGGYPVTKEIKEIPYYPEKRPSRPQRKAMFKNRTTPVPTSHPFISS